jgi:pimeloyl-ACP methyl ester carboxylesterase
VTSTAQTLADLLPFDSHFFGRQGRRQHYLDEGTGTPVVMVHGNPTWCFYYRNLVERLSGDFRCIVPDHLGCGLSDAPAEEDYGYTLDDRVDDLDTLLAHLVPVGPIDLVVHDWGGMIGMAWAHRHPERVGRFVILNTAGFALPSDQPLPRSIAFARSGFGRWLIERHNFFARSASLMAFCKPVSRAVRRAYRAPYEPRHRRVATRRFVEDIPLGPSDPAYATVAAVESGLHRFTDRSALICWGMKDFVFTERFLATWQGHWPHAEVTRYEECGHYVLEDAQPEIVDRIAAFLAPPADG